MNVNYITVFLCILPLTESTLVKGCRTIRFKQSKEKDKSLLNHVIKNVTTESDTLCRHICFMNPQCVSLNIGPSTSLGNLLCQLNDADRFQFPLDFKDNPGFSYQGVEDNQCSANPCSNHSVCLHGYGEQYVCECYPGWHGKNCSSKDLGNGSRIYGDAFLKLFTEKKNWTDARHYCQSLGGDLLSITSSHENDFVKEVFLKQLSIPTYSNDVPDFGVPYQELLLNQSSPNVELKVTAGDVLYKAVDGETALYFSGKADGYADIPEVDISPDGFTITFWIKPLTDGTSGIWVHPMKLYNQQSSEIGFFFYKTGRNLFSMALTSERTYQFIMDFDVWHHFALSVNIITGIRHFVMDGIYFATWNSSIHTSVTNKMKLTLGATKNFYGYIKRILVIKKALDINEIQTITFWNEQGPWIGLNDQENTGQLSWSDGTPVGQYMPFLRDKPKPTQCAAVDKNGTWLDKWCSMKNPFICEKRLNN